jgi:uncharacterized protein YbaP (TraB family)
MRALARFLPLLAALALAAPAAAESFLWEAASLTNRVYLFGTVHAGKADWYPLPDAVESAYQDSKVLVVEADITDEKAIAKSTAWMVYRPPASLATHMPAEQYQRFRRLLPRYRLTEEQVIHLKPFMAVSLLVFAEWSRAGFMPELGVDAYLLKKAKAELKPIVELEGVEVQARLMESLTEAQNQAIFKGTLDALESGLTVEQIRGMVGAWQAGDPQSILEIARRYNERIPGAGEFEEKFVWSRHDDMLRKIEGYLNTSRERHFIAVGALHLAGPRGLVEQLRKRGYIVTQR